MPLDRERETWKVSVEDSSIKGKLSLSPPPPLFPLVLKKMEQTKPVTINEIVVNL
jgi:hypothetical protein